MKHIWNMFAQVSSIWITLSEAKFIERKELVECKISHKLHSGDRVNS